MNTEFPFSLLEHPKTLASCNGWTEEVDLDLLAFQAGRLTRAELDARYLHRKAILTLDLTGFTVNCFGARQVNAFLRILDAQKVCVPVLHESEATLIRAFADDLVALFDDAGRALDAAFEMHRRIAHFNRSGLAADTARGTETLVTGNLYDALRHREDVVFEPLAHDDMLFPYYRASPLG